MNKIAVLIPCYNEEQSIKSVIIEVKKYLPTADIYVYDNNSTDETANIAKSCGVYVRSVSERGKGNVVRVMFQEIDADCFIMIDGDNTYNVSNITLMADKIKSQKVDMVLGVRSFEKSRLISKVSNIILRRLFQSLYHYDVQDVLTGFRAFSKEFVKDFPATATGFETEVEMTSYALSKKMNIDFIDTIYIKRELGSKSKIKLFKDGSKILTKIFSFYIHNKCLYILNNFRIWRTYEKKYLY